MARISLRAYHREIEELIETRQYEQAIAHCRHILKYYPKDVNSYRLLGKAYLESQRYGDASDIFLRVLSTVPDDFVSHVGMSIIREDEGNLDEAIWHMERAFETQPANNAIQSEMRRLHGRREGVEPPKIRLTRGALARMYLKGELYQQAIGELRAGLQEQPKRKDLQVVLAQAYYKSGQRIDAAEICSTLIKSLPYCLEANRILADILKQSDRVEESQIYLKRAISLDPYSAHTSPASPSSDRVPDNAVLLERLDWRPGMPITQAPTQPEWAASLGVDLGTLTSDKEIQPDWLNAPDVSVPPLSSETVQPLEVDLPGKGPEMVPAKEDAIPDWMQEAGWEPASGSVDESSTLPLEENILPDEEILPAEIPEWLKPLAPVEQPDAAIQLPEAGESKSDVSEESPVAVHPWLEETPPQPTDSVITWLGSKPPAPIEEETLELGSAEDVEIPDWLGDLDQKPDVQPFTELPISEDHGAESGLGEEQQFPTWSTAVTAPLAGAMIFDEAISKEGEDKDYLAGLIQDTHEDSAAAGDISEWLESLEPISEGQPSPILDSTDESWGDINAPQLEKTPHEEIPDWLASLEVAAEIREDQTPAVEEIPPDAETEYIETTEELSEELVIPPTEQLPDWLTSEEPAEPIAQEQPETFEELHAPASIDALEVPSATTEPAPLDDDEAFAWLENLAVRQGAEDALLLNPEERRETPPEWVQNFALEAELEPVESGQLDSLETFTEEGAAPEAFAVEKEAEWILEKPEELGEEASVFETADTGLVADVQMALPEEVVFEDATEEGFPEKEETKPVFEAASTVVAGKIIEEAFDNRQAEPAEEMLFYPQESSQVAETIPESSERITLDEGLVLEEDTKPASLQPPEIDLQAATMVTAPLVAAQLIKDEDETSKPEEASEILEEAFEHGEISEAAVAETLAEDEYPPFVELGEQVEGDVTNVEEIPSRLIDESRESALQLDISANESDIPVIEEVISEGAAPPGDEEAFAWLEGLAAKQGTEEAMLLDAEERLDTPPDWVVQSLAAESQEGTESEVESLPDWLQQAEPSEGTEEKELAGEIPDWLKAPAALDDTETQMVPEQESIVPELPTWLAGVEESEQTYQGWVPTEKEIEGEPPELSILQPPAMEGQSIGLPYSEKLDLNEAGLNELERLPGIGFVKAQAIIDHRSELGQFTSVDDLLDIPGISDGILAEFREQVTVGAEETPEIIEQPVNEFQVILLQARNALVLGDIQLALERYQMLIKNQLMIPDVTSDLNEALYRFPVDVSIWEALGDAHVRAGHLQDALDAYTKAEEYIH